MVRQRNYWIVGGAALATAVGGWWLLSPSTKPQQATQSAAEPAQTPGRFRIDAAQERQMGLQWQAAAAATEAPLAELPATIAPPANARVAVTALFPGVVERIMVVEGDSVRRGQPLAVVRSSDVIALHSELSKAQARLGVAQSSAKRLGQLAREGVIAGARADEAAATLNEAQADAAGKRRVLALAGGAGASGSYTLSAPIAGRVSMASAKVGDRLDGATAPFVVDAAGAYEANGQLPERLVAVVRPGMAVQVGDARGSVTAVGSTIEPDTRSVLLKARIPGGPGVIAGGSARMVVMGPAPASAVTVPETAVVTLNGTDTVFVKIAGGAVTRAVKIGGSGGGKVLVLSGLTPGEQVVVAGTSELKALALAQ